MSPSYVTRIDRDGNVTREQRSEDTVQFGTYLRVSEIRITPGTVVFYDHLGNESVVIERGTYPGAGLSVELAEHLLQTR